MNDCLFCKIASGEVPCHKIWEDDKHLAFLSVYPNTEGVSVVITKKHYDSYAYAFPDEILIELTLAVKKVALLIDKALDDVGRTGVVFEGFGINHVHAKLYPLHGTAMETWKPIPSSVDKFFSKYEGYISSHNWHRADDNELARLAMTIREKE